MTREEAIEFGNLWLQINKDRKDSNTYAFFQLAIKALEQEYVLDKIRDEIASYRNRDRGWGCFDGLDRALKIIDNYRGEEG